jgi:enolase
MKIKKIKAIQILDSRGNPTIQAGVKIDDIWGYFSVPSGASTGVHEALELRDGGHDFNGLGVTKAISNIEKNIANELIGKEISGQKELDELLIKLDGTANKANLGANAILAVSAAFSRAAAVYYDLPLYEYLKVIFDEGDFELGAAKEKKFLMPDLYMNILNGGAHAENNVDIQETMIVPHAKTVIEKVKIGAEVYHALKKVLKGRQLSTGLGDEGGFAPNLESNTKGIEMVLEAIESAGYQAGKDVEIALDIAASELYKTEKENKYVLASENIALSDIQMTSLYKEMIQNYPIVSIEDGLAQDDWEGWTAMTERIGKEVQLVGDDLFVTNPKRIQMGIEKKAANAVLIKINQIGTISETFDAMRLANKHKYKCMVSHRSGETCDPYIADLTVATGAGQIKSGAPARSERTSKYNRLIEIESEIDKRKGKNE